MIIIKSGQVPVACSMSSLLVKLTPGLSPSSRSWPSPTLHCTGAIVGHAEYTSSGLNTSTSIVVKMNIRDLRCHPLWTKDIFFVRLLSRKQSHSWCETLRLTLEEKPAKNRCPVFTFGRPCRGRISGWMDYSKLYIFSLYLIFDDVCWQYYLDIYRFSIVTYSDSDGSRMDSSFVQSIEGGPSDRPPGPGEDQLSVFYHHHTLQTFNLSLFLWSI